MSDVVRSPRFCLLPRSAVKKLFIVYRFLSAIALYTSCTILCLLWLLLLIRQKKYLAEHRLATEGLVGWCSSPLHCFMCFLELLLFLSGLPLNVCLCLEKTTVVLLFAFLLACSWNRVLYDDKIHVLESLLLLSMSHYQSLVIPCSSLSSWHRPWHCRRWNPREEGGVVHYGAWGSLLLEKIYGCFVFKVLVFGWGSVRGRKWQQQAKEQAWSSTADPILVHVVSFPNSNAKMHLLTQRKDKILPPGQQNSVNKCWITSFFVYLLLLLIMVCHRSNPYNASLFISCCFCSWFLTGPTPMFLCLSLVVFLHGFSQEQQLNASLFIFSYFCSWFFSQNQLLCFFVYLLLCLFMVSHRTNSYASLFIL